MVFEVLHESYLVPVGEVIEVLEELLFLSVGFEIVFVLQHGLSDHVFSEGPGLLLSEFLEIVWFGEQHVVGVNLIVRFENLIKALLEDWVSGQSSFKEPRLESSLSSLIGLKVIGKLTVLEFKDLLFNNISVVFVVIMLCCVVLEIIKGWVKLSLSSQEFIVHFLINELIVLMDLWIS